MLLLIVNLLKQKENMRMDLKYSINCALEGNAILFAGSGFSYGAININKEKIKNGSSLTSVIAKDCGLEKYPDSLSTISEYYLKIKSTEELIDLIKKECSVLTVCQYHKIVSSLPWKRIYTTNYDSVIEKSAADCMRYLTPVVLSDEIKNADIKNACIHINGYIEKLNQNTINKEFKLTDTSYSCESLVGNEWFELFKSDLQSAKAIIVIGFSMQYDIDIKRLFSSPDIKKKVIFIDKPNPLEIEKTLLENYGFCEFIGIEEFSECVKKLKKDYIPSVVDAYNSFQHEYMETLVPEKVSFEELTNFYVRGNFIDKLAQTDRDGYKYLIYRKAVDVVINNIYNQKYRVFLALSDLGNGKTVFCELVRNELRSKNLEVFYFKHYLSDCEEEIQKISSLSKQSVVIIDDYKDKQFILSRFKNNGLGKITFILTSRKSINPSNRVLMNCLGIEESEIKPLYLDYLTDDDNGEIEKLSYIIKNNKMYSKRMESSSIEDIQNYLIKNCNSRFSDILLNLYNSSDIKNRIITAWKNHTNNNESIHKLVILALMKSVMGLSFNLTEMLDLLQIDFAMLSATDDDFVNEFFNVSENDVLVKSSVVARELLVNTIGLDELLTTMKDVIAAADKEYKVSKKHLNLLKNLVSHSHFRLFKENSAKQNEVLKFYNDIRNYDFCKDNTFFWEQFATASIETKKFGIAKQCIENAFTIAKGIKDFVPFHIETVNANYIIEQLIYNIDNGNKPSPDQAISELINCHDSLLKHFNHPDNNIGYIFRIGSKYVKIFETYKDEFDFRQRSIFIEKKSIMLKKMKEHADDLDFYNHPLNEWIKSLEFCSFENNN